ncbi:MAG: hypothetical protein IT374_19005 [Polyangiaceae bacterium]|nr:hypothetical protein [Polyangiaceae bacterium]
MRARSAVVVALLACACGKPDKASVRDLAAEAKAKDEKLKRDAAEAAAKDKAEVDKLIPRIVEGRRPLDQRFAAAYSLIPDFSRWKERAPCPDAQIEKDSPAPEQRRVLLVNQENLFTMAGKQDAGPVPGFRTKAADEAQWMRRAEGKESLLLERAMPDSADKAQAQLAAIEYAKGFRYLGVGVFTGFRASRVEGTSASPARAEGWTIIVDLDQKKVLCHVESWGENLTRKDSGLAIGRVVYEDAWAMWVHTTAKNLDAVSKVLSVEGAKRR